MHAMMNTMIAEFMGDNDRSEPGGALDGAPAGESPAGTITVGGRSREAAPIYVRDTTVVLLLLLLEQASY